MHIEPGILNQAKLLLAGVTAGGVLAVYARALINPLTLLRSVLAAGFFTLFMQVYHQPVGPSELHFVGAMAIYLTLGFVPTLFGFAAGLLLQGLLFDPADLINLAVNSLSLILPLIGVHHLRGKRLADARPTWQQIVKLDALYYAGVTSMVGFWLSIAEVATPFAAWLSFAASYLVIVAIEPLVTIAAVSLIARFRSQRWVQNCFAVRPN